MTNDDILWRKVEALKQEPPPSPKPPVSGRRKPQKPALPQEAGDASGQETGEKNTSRPEDADTTTPRSHATVVSRYHDTTIPSMLESIRKTVKLVGKEAATHRFTPEEKQAIADIIYTNRRQGYDTSENEIARIGINWLVWDYQENGHDSVLAHVLKALKE